MVAIKNKDPAQRVKKTKIGTNFLIVNRITWLNVLCRRGGAEGIGSNNSKAQEY